MTLLLDPMPFKNTSMYVDNTLFLHSTWLLSQNMLILIENNSRHEHVIITKVYIVVHILNGRHLYEIL